MSDIDPKAEHSREPLTGFAIAVGALCRQWAELEHCTMFLLGALSGMNYDRGTVAILRCFDFRDQLNAIKVGAVARISDGEVVDLIIAAADHIDNVLRNRRNRLVHDRWQSIDGSPDARRINPRPKVFRPQAHQARSFQHEQDATETFEEVWTTVDEVMRFGDLVAALAAHVINPEETTLDELRELRPPPLRPPPQSQTPDPLDNEPPVQPSRLQSSPKSRNAKSP